jgi:hypothetical protein
MADTWNSSSTGIFRLALGKIMMLWNKLTDGYKRIGLVGLGIGCWCASLFYLAFVGSNPNVSAPYVNVVLFGIAGALTLLFALLPWSRKLMIASGVSIVIALLGRISTTVNGLLTTGTYKGDDQLAASGLVIVFTIPLVASAWLFWKYLVIDWHHDMKRQRLASHPANHRGNRVTEVSGS